jgi:Sulfotransferase domain
MRVPDFFIIGHEKCGTTSLFRILNSHPHIFMPEIKETRFFMREALPSGTPRDPRAVRPRTLPEYLSLFSGAGADQRSGEASPQYIRSHDAARRIAALQPDALVIATLREPATFLWTYHLQCVKSGIETQTDLRKALALEPRRRRGEAIPKGCRAPDRLLYAEHVKYVQQLERYADVLSAEQVFVLIYEDFRNDNAKAIREILRFLGVEERAPLASSGSRTGRKGVRSATLNNLTRVLKDARARPAEAHPLLRAANAMTPRALEPLWRRVVYSTPPPPDARVVNELRARFKPEVVALSEYLRRDLVSEWGYRHVERLQP